MGTWTNNSTRHLFGWAARPMSGRDGFLAATRKNCLHLRLKSDGSGADLNKHLNFFPLSLSSLSRYHLRFVPTLSEHNLHQLNFYVWDGKFCEKLPTADSHCEISSKTWACQQSTKTWIFIIFQHSVTFQNSGNWSKNLNDLISKFSAERSFIIVSGPALLWASISI